VFRKASALPIAFRGSSSFGRGGQRGGGDGFDRISGCVTGVTDHVGGGGGVTGSTGGGAGRTFIGVAGSSVGGKCSRASLAARYLATRPGAPGFDGLARAVVFRVVLLEAGEHLLGTVGGLERQQPLVLLILPLGVFNFHQAPFWQAPSAKERRPADVFNVNCVGFRRPVQSAGQIGGPHWLWSLLSVSNGMALPLRFG
jgi:hypothetical protein